MQIPSILLVEDDEIDVETVKRAFREHGVASTLIHAADGVAALEILRGTADVVTTPQTLHYPAGHENAADEWLGVFTGTPARPCALPQRRICTCDFGRSRRYGVRL